LSLSPGEIRGSQAAGMRDRQRHPTRGLTEGAILAALTVIVAAVGLIAPFVGVLLAPLPIMLLVIRWGLRIGVLASVVAALLLLQFFGPVIATPIVAAFVTLGLALGWGVRRGLAAHLTIFVGAAAFFFVTTATFAIYAAALHQDPIGELIQIQVSASQTVASIQQRLGAPPQQIEEMRALWEPSCSEHHCVAALMPPVLRTVFPLILALGALISAYLCYTVARAILRRVGHELPGVPPLLAWRLHPFLVSVMLWLTAGLTILGLRFSPAAGAALNVVFADLFAFGFQGALVGITWMNRRRIPRFAQVMAGILLLQTSNGSIAALAILGLLDSWFDFRRLTCSPAGASSSVGPAEKQHSPAPARVKVAPPQ
jgi:uncharacterized protein YybS (DUF2232 family)